ncbi:MAG: histidine kinase [Bacilli bacterium]|nr:histidine kinase [Bacilli bacterium]
MKIRTRLLLGFGAMLLLMSALAGIGINRLSLLSGSMDELYQNRYAKVKLAYNIRVNVTDASRSLMNLMMNDPATDVVKETENANQSINKAGTDFIQLGKISQDASEKKLITDLTTIGKSYFDYKEQILKFIASNQINAAYELRKNQGSALQTSLFAQLDQLVAFHEQAMNQAYNSSIAKNKDAVKLLTCLLIAGLLLGLGIMVWILFSLSNGLNRVVKVLSKFSNGDFGVASRIHVISKDEIGEVAQAFNSMAEEIENKSTREKEYNRSREEQTWLKSNVAQMTTVLQSVGDLREVAQTFLREVAAMIQVNCGSFYLNEMHGNERLLNLYGVYAYKPLNPSLESIRYGEGLIGQCALDKKAILLKDIPRDYMNVYSSLGHVTPANLLLYPVLFEGELVAVIELASLFEFTSVQLTLLDQLSVTLGITINSISGRKRVEELLRISQALTDELQAQSEELLVQQNELKDSNELLRTQTKRLLNSEELLQKQQEELQESNEQLIKKSQQLASSSKYKSEFLANMSHELRTPLNSMLILSQLLVENKDGNMLPKQIEFAHAIHTSGSDLIRLIDEILDLSKVEAGKIEIMPELVELSDLKENISRSFIFLANKKNLSFNIHVDDEVPPNLYIDSYRVEQILNNLLSNAFKFTKQGGVTLAIALASDHELKKVGLKQKAKVVIAFSVTDTGIGIPEEKLDMIFEAFQQENGTTSRKFGGTGLGLSISRELARLMSGKIGVTSDKGVGSTFTLYLPEIYWDNSAGNIYEINREAAASKEAMVFLEDIMDDRSTAVNETASKESLFAGKKILIVEDDIRNIFALSSVFESYNMKVAFAENGQQALQIITEQEDFDLILMDIMMPEMDGYEAIKLVRSNPQFAKLPIIALTAKMKGNDREKCFEAGVSDYISKPIHIEQLLSLMCDNLMRWGESDGV